MMDFVFQGLLEKDPVKGAELDDGEHLLERKSVKNGTNPFHILAQTELKNGTNPFFRNGTNPFHILAQTELKNGTNPFF
jgi:hypothetical protein